MNGAAPIANCFLPMLCRGSKLSGAITSSPTSSVRRFFSSCDVAFVHNSRSAEIRQSECEKRIFGRNSLDHLEALPRDAGLERLTLVVFESPHSMDGNRAAPCAGHPVAA